VALAADAGLCTLGFVRSHRFVAYSVPGRVAG
jgi:formate dehydrogenase assembly factor FdhD